MLKKAAAASSSDELSCSRAAVINMTSRMGSIDDNTSGGSYPYRSSKVKINVVVMYHKYHGRFWIDKKNNEYLFSTQSTLLSQAPIASVCTGNARCFGCLSIVLG